MKIQVIESSSLDKPTEWGISFTCNNPNPEDYLKTPDKETAFRYKRIFESIEEYHNIYGLIDEAKLFESIKFAILGQGDAVQEDSD